MASSRSRDSSAESTQADSSWVAPRSSLVESLKNCCCGLSGARIDKRDLNCRILIPKYLRTAMAHSIRSKDLSLATDMVDGDAGVKAPETPMVVFVNSCSGGRLGSALKVRLQELISEEQVFDLSVVNPSDFIQYGLACLEKLASLGDLCAKETRERLRILVAGGDGTIGWVLGSLSELHTQNRGPIPPTGIIPLGTGNDLSRSFGWGGSFPFAWRIAVKHSLYKAVTGPVQHLDSWHVVVSMVAGETVELPHCLKHLEEHPFGQAQDIQRDLPEKRACFGGVFYNYYSIGMDAQVAYGFHHLRNKKPYLAQGPITNKLIYSAYSCSQGWFFTPCLSDPSLRGLSNILRLHIKKVNCTEWEEIQVPSSVRAVVALNLHNYGSGRNPWGHQKREYLDKRGFVEAHFNDGLLEIFGLKQGWHASFVMVELISAKHIAQATSIRLEIKGGQRIQTHMQMDGEPWKQPINGEYSTIVDIRRVSFPSLMISGG